MFVIKYVRNNQHHIERVPSMMLDLICKMIESVGRIEAIEFEVVS